VRIFVHFIAGIGIGEIKAAITDQYITTFIDELFQLIWGNDGIHMASWVKIN